MAVKRATVVAARAAWSAVVRSGQTLTVTDLHGNQAVDFLVYDAPRQRPSATAPPTRSTRRATSS